MRHLNYILAATLLAPCVANAETPKAGMQDLPSVPVSVTDGKKKVRKPRFERHIDEQKQVVITVKAGVTELVEVSQNYLNRIITPFDNPKVVSASPMEFRKEGNTIYIQPGQTAPVGLYVLPQNTSEDGRAISLALIPKKVPPKTIKLTWTSDNPQVGLSVASKKAEKWEVSSSYEDTLLNLNEMLAKGTVPPGYSIREADQSYVCDFSGLKATVGQVLNGAKFSVLVLKATNVSNNGFTIAEESCFEEGVVAIATWPKTYLAPGDSTEMYITKKQRSEAGKREVRSRLID
jgi:conjugal transfer pilus assembly protein TraK